MKIIISKLVKNFDFELVKDQDLNPILYATMRPKDGTMCFITERKF